MPEPTCIHGKPLDMTPDEVCQPCIDLITEEVRRRDWLDSLTRFTQFFQNHPDFIPQQGVYVHLRRHGEEPQLARTAVFDLLDAAGALKRTNGIFPEESKVEVQAFGPHRFHMTVPNEAIGTNVVKPTDQWEWDEAIFGEPA